MINFIKSIIKKWVSPPMGNERLYSQRSEKSNSDVVLIPPTTSKITLQKERIESANSPPSFENVPPRVGTVDVVSMASFWRESLTFVDFSAIGSFGKPDIQPIELLEIENAFVKSAADADNAALVDIVICLWQVRGKEGFLPAGMRHPLLSIPAFRHADGGTFFARTESAPLINEEYLAPNLGKVAFSIGFRDEAHRLLEVSLEKVLEDPSLSIGWTEYLKLLIAFLYELTAQYSIKDLESHLSDLANEVLSIKSGAKKNQKHNRIEWKLVACVVPTKPGALFVEQAYESLINAAALHTDDTKLFQQICKPSQVNSTAEIPRNTYQRYVGHMDERTSDGQRSLFPLDRSQRTAVQSILALKRGQLQAVNGPPGSGKTSMLRAVVASIWVDAAINKADCPIIVACGATNQSVTNVIEAFGEAPHIENNAPFARRWIADVPSYGGYFPSKSIVGNPKKDAELKRLVIIQPSNKGFPFTYWGRPDVMNPVKTVLYEAEYCKHAAHFFNRDYFESLEDAVALVWSKLDEVHRKQKQFIRALENGRDWFELGSEAINSFEKIWTTKRREIAFNCLNRLKEYTDDQDARDDFIDLTWRSESFHWAARYWEGQFLLKQRERLLSRHPENIKKALQRLCMLTPCLVSTLHMLPRLVEIDEELSGPISYRKHAFGLFDLLVVDEAGQALPQLVGIAFAFAKTAAVVGDLKQLPPISQTSAMAERAIARKVKLSSHLDSIVRAQRSPATGSALGMARLVSRWRDFADDGVTLQYHYRCKPSIFEYCNELCYGKLLKTRTNEQESFVESALGWVEVDAEPTRAGGSYCNIPEANEIVDWIIERWPIWRIDVGTAGKTIQNIVAIVTPYKSQSDYFMEALKARIAPLRNTEPSAWPSDEDIEKITIGTVHRLQGAERPIICFSLVEGPEQGANSFIDKDTSMMNVAVSRAKRSFVIFANPKRLFGGPSAGFASTAAPVHKLGDYLTRTIEAKRLYPNQLVIIEAGGKKRTLELLFGKDALVIPTQGALTKLQEEEGVDILSGLVPRPIMENKAINFLEDAKRGLASVSKVIIATDNDRMGEYIAWQAARFLSKEFNNKPVKRLRLGAITRGALQEGLEKAGSIDPKMVLAEAAREVTDSLITSRFAMLAKTANVKQNPLHDELIKIGAVQATSNILIGFVGRVQGAILRLLLDEARDVYDSSKRRSIEVTLETDNAIVRGFIVTAESNNICEFDEQADLFASELSQGALQLASLPFLASIPFVPSAPGTVDIVGLTWRTKQSIPPWIALDSLQDLYTGNWSGEKPNGSDPSIPIESAKTDRGHPPIIPLDAGCAPESMIKRMKPNDNAVYKVVWDFYQVANNKNLREERLSIRLSNDSAPGFELLVEGASIKGLPTELQYVLTRQMNGETLQSVNDVQQIVMQLHSIRVRYRDVPAKHWNVGVDSLLWKMEDMHIGRPSTYISALEKLADKGLIALPVGVGSIQLTSSGLATAFALEEHEERLSAPTFSSEMTARLKKVESGELGPREVLASWLPWLTPQIDWRAIGPRIWNTLPELEAAMDTYGTDVYPTTLITQGDISSTNKASILL